MIRHQISALILPCLLFSAAVLGEDESATKDIGAKCAVPNKPAIPNGRDATEDQMLAAQKTLKSYLAEGDTYLACLDQVEAGWGEAATEEQRAVVMILHNRLVDEMQTTADLFNQSVRAFKGKRGQ